jgi:hypothetical protein
MPAPRSCRSCGAELPPDLRWCTRCYAPTTEFAARARLHDGFVGTPSHEIRTSRWRRTATTFGPSGRLAITGLVALFVPIGFWTMGSAFWPLGLWFLLGYALFASLVLRSVWRPVRITEDDEAARVPPWKLRHPVLGRELAVPRGLARVAGAASIVALGWAAVTSGDELHRFFALAAILIFGLGFVLARWLDLS